MKSLLTGPPTLLLPFPLTGPHLLQVHHPAVGQGLVLAGGGDVAAAACSRGDVVPGPVGGGLVAQGVQSDLGQGLGGEKERGKGWDLDGGAQTCPEPRVGVRIGDEQRTGHGEGGAGHVDKGCSGGARGGTSNTLLRPSNRASGDECFWRAA